MYPMLLLCLHLFLHPVIAGIGCEGLRASRRFEKCTMRMLVHCFALLHYFCPLTFPVTETLRAGKGPTVRSMKRLRCVPLVAIQLTTATSSSNRDNHVYAFGATYHRCHRSFPAQFHSRHGKELFPGLLYRQTRVEALATRPCAGDFSVIERALRVHCSGFPHFSSPYSFN